MDYLEVVTSQAATMRPRRTRIAGAVGPELRQAAVMGSRRRAAPFDQPRANDRLDGRAVRYADDVDAGNPQPIPNRPGLRNMVSGDQVAIDTAMPYLPGPKPPMGWDGEHDAASPWAVDG